MPRQRRPAAEIEAERAILRKVGARQEVIRTARRPGLTTFEVAPQSVEDQAAFERAAEAHVGGALAAFLRPPGYAAYHFEVAQ